MGKIGHGEFKQWTDILSKKNLKSRNQALKAKAPPEESGAISAPCQACAKTHGWSETPALLSACLVSTEPEPHLRVMTSAAPSASYGGGSGGEGAGGTGSGGALGFAGTGGAGVKPSNASASVSSSGKCPAANSNKPSSAGAGGYGRQANAGVGAGVQQQWWNQAAGVCTDDRSITHIMVFQVMNRVWG